MKSGMTLNKQCAVFYNCSLSLFFLTCKFYFNSSVWLSSVFHHFFCHFINFPSLFRLWSKCKRIKSQAKKLITLLESLYFRCFLYFCKTEINKICQIRKRFVCCQLICLHFNFWTFMNDQQLYRSFWLGGKISSALGWKLEKYRSTSQSARVLFDHTYAICR